MKEKEQRHSSIEPSRRAHAGEARAHPLSAERKLLLMRAGGYFFAVFADEVDCVVEARTPTPLPHAPPAVRGVVSVRGRMRTLLDSLILLTNEEASSQPQTHANENAQPEHEPLGVRDSPPPTIIALQGDEQLALLAETANYMGGVAPESIEPHTGTGTIIRATFAVGDTRILILHPSRLFEAAMRGTDRRRPR
jgi:chemotaxis signal transduction protein